jgi:CBS domain-containing protein
MEESQIRRVAVVDANGACCGIVAQADVANNASESKTAEVVQEVSKGAAI